MKKKSKKLTKERVLEVVGDKKDLMLHEKWTHKVFSPNYDELPTVYLEDLDEAYGYYYLYILYGAQNNCASGTRFCLESRDGDVIDTGSFGRSFTH